MAEIVVRGLQGRVQVGRIVRRRMKRPDNIGWRRLHARRRGCLRLGRRRHCRTAAPTGSGGAGSSGAAGVSGAGEAGFSAFSVFADVSGLLDLRGRCLRGFPAAGADRGGSGIGPGLRQASARCRAWPASRRRRPAGAAFGSSFAGGSVALLAGGFGAASLGSAAGGCSFGDFASGDLSPARRSASASPSVLQRLRGDCRRYRLDRLHRDVGHVVGRVLDFFGSTTGLEVVGAGFVGLAAGWAGVTAAFALLMVRRALATTAFGSPRRRCLPVPRRPPAPILVGVRDRRGAGS